LLTSRSKESDTAKVVAAKSRGGRVEARRRREQR
jgi:hypothetical protein